MTRLQTLRQRKADLVASARALFVAAQAESRSLTDEERARDDAIQAELEALNLEMAREERQAARERELVGQGAMPTRPETTDPSEFQTLGEFLQAVAYAGMPGRQVDPRLVAASGMSSGIPSDGGFLVRTEWSKALLGRIFTNAVLAPKCRQIPIGAGFDGLEAPYIDETSRATGSRWGGVQVYRAAEAAAVTASKPKLGKFELRLEELKGLCYLTDRLLRDATAVEAIVNQAFEEEFAFRLDDEIINGTGAGQCLGILNAGVLVTVAKETGQTAATIVAENIIKMHSRMRARNMAGSVWFINQDSLPQLYTMAIAVGVGGVPVYMPANGLSGAPYGTLFGRPVQPIEQAATIGTVGDVLFLDLSEYVLITKAMSAASSMHVRFIYDEMTFRWTWPVNGRPALASAITPYKGSNTVSPFVALATRA